MNRFATRRIRPGRWSLAIALAAVIASCSPTPSIALTTSPSQALLPLGGSVDVEVTLVRSGGATADVALLASGLPSGVSASFTPATLSGPTTTSTLTLSSAAGADEGVTTVTITGTGVGLTASSQLTLEVDSQDVTGTVVGIYGEPLEGLTVYVSGHVPTATAGDGSFTVVDVAVPYDLTIASGVDWAQTVVGLRTTTPQVQPFLAATTPPLLPTATVNGDLIGGFSPVPAGFRVQICAEGIDVVVWGEPGCVTLFQGETSYSFNVAWAEGGSVDVRVRAYVYELDGNSTVTGIVGNGSLDLTLVDGVTSSNDLNIAASSPTWADLELTTSAPAGSDISATVLTHVNDHASYSNVSSSVLSSPVQLVSPLLSGAQYSVVVSASTTTLDTSIGWLTGLTSGDAVELAVPPAPNAISPADGATGVDESTLFTVTKPHGGSAHFVFAPVSPATGPRLFVSTAGSSVTIPDLSAIGIALTPAVEHSWQVLTTPQTEDPDGIVSGSGYLGPYLEIQRSMRGGPVPTADGSLYVSTGGSFTTD